MASTSVAATRIEIPGVELGEELGRGAHSVVYAGARDGRALAIKVALESSEPNEAERQRFVREATLLASLRHPSFAEIFEIGERSGRAYLVMERVEGQTLAERMRERRLTPDRVAALGMDIAEGLAAIHRRGLVHRDVKPNNVVVDARGKAKLIDFGLVTRSGDEHSNEIGGTFLYSAPEQTGLLKRPIDGRADLYALGVVLYECVAGQTPFRSSDPGELMRQHAVMEPPRLEEVSPEAHPILAQIIHRLLAKDPDDRYQTAEGLAADLGRLHELSRALADHREVLLGRDDFSYGVLRESPLIGREPELRRLKKAWNATLRGRGCTVCVAGPSGVGKTRLLSTLMGHVRETSGLVLCARGRADRQEPFAALQGALASLLDHMARLPEESRAVMGALVIEASEDAQAHLLRALPRLRAVLGTTKSAATEVVSSEEYHETIAEFFLRLARSAGGVALFVDDAEHVDDASMRVFERVALGLASSPFALFLGVGEERTRSLDELRTLLGRDRLVEVTLHPLSHEATERLLASYLGVSEVGADLVQPLMVRTEGSPLLISEYLRAMLEGGMLLPHWGRWIVDRERLEHIELSSGVLQLVRQRIETLDAEAVAILRAAAVLGTRFELALLRRVCGSSDESVDWAVAEALRSRLLEREPGGSYAFIHQQVRAAFLEELDPAAERELNRAAAEAIRALYGEEDDTVLYALAHHAYLGNGPRLYETSLRAGTHALASYAYEEAHGYLSRALGAERERARNDLELQRSLGVAAGRTGRTTEAVEHLRRAVEMTEDRVQRAELHAMLAQVHVWDSFHTAAAWREVENGLAAIGSGIARWRVTRVLRALLAWLRGYVIQKTGIGFATASGETRERLIVFSRLLKLAGHVRYWTMQPSEMVLLILRMAPPAFRLGPGKELVYTHISYALALAAVGRHRLSERSQQRALEVSRSLGDRALEAYSRMNGAIAANVRGHLLASEHEMKDTLSEHGGFLDYGEYTQGIADLSWQLQLRGHVAAAHRWVERGLAADRRAEFQRGQIFLPSRAAICLATLGRAEEARDHLDYARGIAENAPGDTYRLGNYLSHLAFYHLELGHLEEALAALKEYRELGIPPARSPFHMRNTYVFAAYAMAEHAASGAGRASGLDTAIEELRSVSRHGHPLLTGHLEVIRARRIRLFGRPEAAHPHLDAALRWAFAADAPWIEFEAKLERAVVLEKMQHDSSAARLAREAYEQALDAGWIYRARRVRREFEQLNRATRTQARSVSRSESDAADLGNARAVQLQRHVDALVQVSRVSLSVIDADQQARAILDEVVSLFGAERAFLFLVDVEREGGELQLYAARNSIRGNLRDTQGYSTQVIERVLGSRAPVVIASNEDAVAIGSESAIALNLRSIIAAPLMIRDRLVGVVYLDNRLAKGVFTEDDAETLTAVSSHIAIAIETSRTATLEMRYKAERDKRKLAEALRALTTSSTPTTDDAQIVTKLLDSVLRFIPATRASCYILRDREWRWLANKNEGADTRVLEGGEGTPVPRVDLLNQIRDTQQPHLVRLHDESDRGALPNVDPRARSWLAVPLIGGEQVRAVLTLESHADDGLDDGHLELAQTFAGQAGMSIDNIHLFQKVQQLATVDELTGVSNRRSLFEFARNEFRRSRRYQQPMSLLMIDVDHFKPVNDTHGHAVGDVVLRQMATRCSECARDVDHLGRYGGEEFMMVAPLTSAKFALKLAERIRNAVESRPFTTSAGELLLTVSLGVAELEEGDESVEDILERADGALYRAKRDGRNRVACDSSREG